MKKTLWLVSLFGLKAFAFPGHMMDELMRRQVPSTEAARAQSAARTNCGLKPCLVFDAKEQYVSISGEHAYKDPSSSDIRGPCPGLNAAANHGYISRNGISTIVDSIAGLGAAFGMHSQLAGFLAAYAVLTGGDPVAGTWSIGGPLPSNPLTKGLFGAAQGISYSHNVYEGDSSIGRNDAYLNRGDAYSLNIKRFQNVYDVGQKDGSDRYTLDKFAQNFRDKVLESIATNPYYFAAPFATTLVSPAAYNFVINFMSNHTAKQPNGYLDGAMFKQFFAVTGDSGNFKWQPGKERIPNNWYRRPSTAQYDAASATGDVALSYAAYPASFRVGGNTNGVNTYEGVDLSNLTGGLYQTSDLIDPKNTKAACFYAQLAQAVLPDVASVAVGIASAVTSLVNQYIKPFAGDVECPVVSKYDQSLFNKFPGYGYKPQAPCTSWGC